VSKRRVDEIDPELEGALKNGQCPFPIFRRSPDAIPGQAHRSEAETMNRNFPAERNVARKTWEYLIVHRVTSKFVQQALAVPASLPESRRGSVTTLQLWTRKKVPRFRGSERSARDATFGDSEKLAQGS
jgi:hypothetical protein